MVVQCTILFDVLDIFFYFRTIIFYFSNLLEYRTVVRYSTVLSLERVALLVARCSVEACDYDIPVTYSTHIYVIVGRTYHIKIIICDLTCLKDDPNKQERYHFAFFKHSFYF